MTQLSETARENVEQFVDRLLEPDMPENLERKFWDTVYPIVLKKCHDRFNGNQSQMATAMGVNRATLRTRLKRYELL